MSSRGKRWTRNRWNNGGQYQERGGRNFSQRGGQGPRGRGRDDEYSLSSHQNSGTIKSTMSKVIPRLGLPVRGRGLKTRSRGRMAQQSWRDVGPSWYKILIPYGRQFGKDFILNSLRSYVDGDIYPVLFKFLNTGKASFFLENSDEAESVRAANKRIRTQNGKSMEIRKFAVPCPFIPCDSEEASLIKDVLGSRYDAANRHLNLSSFSLDPVLKGHDKYCSLQKNNVVMLVSKLIGENYPEVRSIDLSGNSVRYLDYLSAWVPRAKHVQRVSFAQNQIQNMQELEKMKGWDLVEIELDHNPLCLLFYEKTPFISAVHKIFPKVTLLDTVAVEPEIRFELEDEVANPDKRTIPNFLEAENNRELQRKVNSLHEKLKSEKESAQNAIIEAAQMTESNWTKDTMIVDLQMQLSEQKRMCNCRILSAKIEEIKKKRLSDQSKFVQYQAEMKSKLEKERKMFQNKTSEDLKGYGLEMAKRDMIIHQQNEQLKKEENFKEQAQSKISELRCELQNLKSESEAKSRKIEEKAKELCTSGHALILVSQMSAECGQRLIKDNATSSV